jgi:L-ascorbate metabolism protein UlaG (beta-lactamase superfamily)
MQKTTGTIIVCNLGAYALLKSKVAAEKLVLLEPGESAEVKGAKVTAIESVHPGRKPLMFIVEVDEVSLFHGSDSGYTSDLEEYRGRAKVAFVPVGRPSPTASVEDASEWLGLLDLAPLCPYMAPKRKHHASKRDFKRNRLMSK